MAHSATFARLTRGQTLACFSLAALIDLAIGAWLRQLLPPRELLNPDSYMRLVRLHDLLARHAPLDAVLRDGSGIGTRLHWSHLLDSLLLVLAAPLAPWLGWQAALPWAGLALGPLVAGLLGTALAWAAAPLSDPAWRWTAALSATLMLPILGYTLPGVVHHHALVALAVVMCAGWAARAVATPTVATVCTPAGIHLGAWAAFGLWLSPEAMPLALLAFGAIGLAWLLQPGERGHAATLAAATTTLAMLAGLALAADPPADAALPALDRLSSAWLCLALLGAGAAWCFVGIDRMALAPAWRGLAGGAVAAGAAIAWLALFPDALRGPGGIVEAAASQVFFADIAEMQPVRSWPDAVTFLLPGGFAAMVAAVVALRQRSFLWAYATACVVLLVLVAATHRRFSTYGACAGAIALPVAITLASACLRDRPPVVAAAVRLLLLLLVLVGPYAPPLLAGGAAAAPAAACSVRAVAPALDGFAGQVVLADVSLSPELLYRSRILTVGSLYHGNVAGFLRLRAAWRSRDDGRSGVPPDVAATGAGLVLFCRHAGRTRLVADLPADTLWDRIGRGEVPAWLEEVPVDPASGFRLFRVR
ncbi:MAG: hypothetical protein WDN25_27615 [Acetobacteraceae bacterium]